MQDANKTQSSPDKLKAQFREALHGAQLQQLFNYLPGVYFVVKNRKGQVMMANQLAAQLCGKKSEKELIGKNDRDLFPPEQAEHYIADDQQVFETGEAIVDRIELAPNPNHAINWFITTKIPLYDTKNEIIGLACIARNMEDDSEKIRPYVEMNEVLEWVRVNHAEPIKVSEMARVANLSLSQFERRFKKVFHITPMQHLNDVRIQAACHLLKSTHHTIASIALDTGFYDHSHLVRSFKRALGVSPSKYREKPL